MATDKKDDNLDKDPDLVMVGDGVDDEEAGRQAAAEADDDQDDDQFGDDDDDEAPDQRLGGGEAEDDESRKEARRNENKSRRQRQKEARERDQRELTFLRQRNEQIERQISDLATKQNQSEQRTIEGRISQLENAIRQADDVYAKAIDAGEGKDAAEAMRIRDALKDQRDGLKSYKAEAEQTARIDPGPDPALIENVRTWHERNQYFDFGRRDEDSAIVGAIDDMMVRDGWDPRTPDYYNELDKRIARRLPHLKKKAKGNGRQVVDDDDDDGGDAPPQKRRSAGPKFRVGGRDRPLRSNEVHISRDRRQAMEDAGVWEDPVLRKNYLKRYAEWDKEHADELNRA